MFTTDDERVYEILDCLYGDEYYEYEHDDDPDWPNRVDREWTVSEYDSGKYSQDMLELRDMLLSIGGRGVVMIDPDDPDARKINERGRLLHGENPVMMIGEHNQCHSNSAHLWDRNRDNTFLCTGYALSTDGLWRQHSWCVQIDPPAIAETTTERLAYYGFAMTEDEAEKFLYDNY